jgi:hypothetical protein
LRRWETALSNVVLRADDADVPAAEIPGSARFTYLGLFDSRDSHYARVGLLDHVNSDGFTSENYG